MIIWQVDMSPVISPVREYGSISHQSHQMAAPESSAEHIDVGDNNDYQSAQLSQSESRGSSSNQSESRGSNSDFSVDRLTSS